MAAQKREALTAATGKASSDANPNRKESNVANSNHVATGRAITVPFHGCDLYVVEHNGQPYTPMKPIVEGMGLDWNGQHKKVAANEGRWGISMMEIPSVGGLQAATCIPLRKLPGWLATLEPSRIKSLEVRDRVAQFQNECDDALWQYWNDGIAVNPRALYSVNQGDVLTRDEAETLRLMLKTAVDRLPKSKQAAAMVKGWSKLKAHFHVPYREIPRHEFTEAVSIIARHTAEWDLVDEPTDGQIVVDREQLSKAFSLATEAVQEVAKSVFEAVINSGQPATGSSRYMMGVGWDPERKVFDRPYAAVVDRDAVVMSLPEMARRLRGDGGEFLARETELAELGAAISWKQARIAERRAVDRERR